MSRAVAQARGLPSRQSLHVQVLAIAAVSWGALAFGAVYPWAYWPVALMCAAAGTIGLTAGHRGAFAVLSPALAIGLVAVALATGVQLIPLPVAWLGAISPGTVSLLQQTDFGIGAGAAHVHTLSVKPSSTVTALILYTSFAALMAGMTRVLSLERARRTVEAVTLFAVVLALIGIVQKPLYRGRVLGFWEPETVGNPFGPYINRNHFAGWMLMALPLTLALVCAGFEQGMRGVRPGWRPRVLWLSSPEASRLVLLAAAAMVMALSLILTLSRSGISALALSLVLTGWIVARGLKGQRSRRAAGAGYLLILAITTLGWAGADAVATRFSEARWSGFNDRRGAWADALNVWRAFPAAGTGLNTYEIAARFYQRHDTTSFYGESHNDYLQVLAEGGLLVAIPAAFCAVVFARDVRRRMKRDSPSTSWWLRRGAVTSVIAIGLQETVDFSLQMPGNAVLFTVVCALALHRPRETQEPAAPPSPHDPSPRLRVVVSNAVTGTR